MKRRTELKETTQNFLWILFFNFFKKNLEIIEESQTVLRNNTEISRVFFTQFSPMAMISQPGYWYGYSQGTKQSHE